MLQEPMRETYAVSVWTQIHNHTNKDHTT